MKKINFVYIATAMIIIFLFVLGYSVYQCPLFPDKVATHWNFNGQPDGYMNKFWGSFLVPIMNLFFFILFLVLPRIDPHKENYEKFKKYYDLFSLVLIAFFAYIYVLSLGWNLNGKLEINRSLILSFAALFFSVGVLTEKTKKNWFVGIKTPWTLQSDAVWEKTNRLAGRLLKISAIIIAAGFFLAIEKAIFLTIILPLVVFLGVSVYSYFVYRKETR